MSVVTRCLACSSSPKKFCMHSASPSAVCVPSRTNFVHPHQIQLKYRHPNYCRSHCHLLKHVTWGRLVNCLWLVQASVKLTVQISVKNYNFHQSLYTLKYFWLHNCQTVQSAIKQSKQRLGTLPCLRECNYSSVNTRYGAAVLCQGCR